jgi:CelD/BcsL family acetyltransferase involved in cellulose biosynthesis
MRLLPLSAVSADDLSAWNRLGERAIEPNPFAEAAFVPSAAEALGAERVQLLVAERDGEWLGCMPIEIRRVLGLPILASTWSHPYSFLGTPLVTRDGLAEFAAELAASLRTAEHCRFLILRTCGDGPVLAALEAAAAEARLAPIFERRFERGAYEGRGEEEQLSWMKSRHSDLRRLRRKIEKDLGQEVVARERPHDAATVDAFLNLESAGWKGKQGTAMATDSGGAELFRDVCAGFASRERLLLRSLETADGRVLAMTCALSAGDALFGFKAAYDEEMRKYSPGIQLHVEDFGSFDAERPERIFDSCGAPDSETINSLWPDRRPLATIALGRRGAMGKAVGRTLERAHQARSDTA